MSIQGMPGQPRAKRFLRQIIVKGHVPHALLFTGMAGIGKAAAAREFAKALNCLSPSDGDGCDECLSCRKIAADNHSDFLWIASEGNFIKLDQIRSLRERVRFRPFEGKWRVVVLQDAHKLKEEAGNALLKLLEEPPRQNLFVLLALEPQMLLRTIVSRCCHVRFQPLENQWIEQQLIATYEMPASRAKEATRLAEGSMERAKWWAESDRISQWEELLRKVQSLRDLPMLDFFALTAQWAKESEDLEQDLECIKLWVRDLILSRLMKDGHADSHGGRPGLHPGDPVVSNLFHLYNEVELAMQRLRQNANKQLTLEGACLAIKDKLYGKGSRNSLPGGRQDLSL
jgi:DNA polymerase-3 subunit delta'